MSLNSTQFFFSFFVFRLDNFSQWIFQVTHLVIHEESAFLTRSAYYLNISHIEFQSITESSGFKVQQKSPILRFININYVIP